MGDKYNYEEANECVLRTENIQINRGKKLNET